MPSRSTARCTCASDAAASGVSSTLREHLVERPAELVLDPAPHLGERARRHGVVEAAEAADERRGEDVGARADDLAELHEEAGQVDAEVVEAARDAVVDALPGGRRRRPAHALAQQQPAVGEDGRHRHAGDAQHPIGGERRSMVRDPGDDIGSSSFAP